MKIKDILTNIKLFFYSIPFGMKKADAMIFGSSDANGDNDISISQEVNDERVSKHLLKGEVTQEVEELRYRTYKVEKESKEYSYLGDGVAVKKERPRIDENMIRFSMNNKVLSDSVLDSMQQVGRYGTEKYVLNVNYNSISRFKIEQFATKFTVTIKNGECYIKLYFEAQPDVYDSKSKPFINELERIYQQREKNLVLNSDIVLLVSSISFITYKADGEDDLVYYNLLSPTFADINKTKFEYTITYKISKYSRENLTDKFYNEEMENKYKNKEPKNVAIDLSIKK